VSLASAWEYRADAFQDESGEPAALEPVKT
jgi:hypothetical protein